MVDSRVGTGKLVYAEMSCYSRKQGIAETMIGACQNDTGVNLMGLPLAKSGTV